VAKSWIFVGLFSTDLGWEKDRVNFSCQFQEDAIILNQMVKYNGFSSSLDATFSALADPTRRRILESLSRQQKRVTDLAEPFAMSLPAVSKHLRVLEDAGLLKRRRFGREHHLEVEPAPMRDAQRWIEHYRKFWEGSLDSLANYLEKTNKPTHKKKGKKT
jgi:DNA-binding transcriptional ArsR family regulator